MSCVYGLVFILVRLFVNTMICLVSTLCSLFVWLTLFVAVRFLCRGNFLKLVVRYMWRGLGCLVKVMLNIFYVLCSC